MEWYPYPITGTFATGAPSYIQYIRVREMDPEISQPRTLRAKKTGTGRHGGGEWRRAQKQHPTKSNAPSRKRDKSSVRCALQKTIRSGGETASIISPPVISLRSRCSKGGRGTRSAVNARVQNSPPERAHPKIYIDNFVTKSRSGYSRGRRKNKTWGGNTT